MIIVKIMGGLGNQLQQYAIYRKFEMLGVEAALDLSWFAQKEQKKQLKPRDLELDFFENLPYRICSEGEKVSLVGKDDIVSRIWEQVRAKLGRERKTIWHENGRMYQPELFDLRDAYLTGYFACEKYYVEVLEQLRQDIRFPEPENPKNRELAERLRTEESVSIHLRRGDYLDAENAALFGNICTPEYYDMAVRKIKEQHPNARFYIFSDDPAYARSQYLGEEFCVVDWNHGKDSFYDMYLMSRCKHNICANSTFSFWGARLNDYADKIMIRPLKHRNNQEYDRTVMEELWQGWILL